MDLTRLSAFGVHPEVTTFVGSDCALETPLLRYWVHPPLLRSWVLSVKSSPEEVRRLRSIAAGAVFSGGPTLAEEEPGTPRSCRFGERHGSTYEWKKTLRTDCVVMAPDVVIMKH